MMISKTGFVFGVVAFLLLPSTSVLGQWLPLDVNNDSFPRPRLEILDPTLPRPNYDQRPDTSADIYGYCIERTGGITNSQNRQQTAQQSAYAQYAALCISRALLGLPMPTIYYEDYLETKWLLPNDRGIEIVGVYSIWLDDPLEVLEPVPDPISTPGAP